MNTIRNVKSVSNFLSPSRCVVVLKTPFTRNSELNLRNGKMLATRVFSLLPVRIGVNALSTRGLRQTLVGIKPEFDSNYLTNPANVAEIKSNIAKRKGVGDIDRVHDLLKDINGTADPSIRGNLQQQLQDALKLIPNRTHPDVVDYDHPKEIGSIGSKRVLDSKPHTFENMCKRLNILRTNELGNFNGSRSYYTMNDLVELVSRFLIGFVSI